MGWGEVMADEDYREIGQLLHTASNSEPLRTIDGKLFVKAEDLESLFRNGAAKFKSIFRNMLPFSLEHYATTTKSTTLFDGVIDTITNDGSDDLQVSFDNGANWHTIKVDETWSPGYDVFINKVSYRGVNGTTEFRIWGWKEVD